MAGAQNQPLQLSVEQSDLQAVAKILRSEADGKELRKMLVRDLRQTAQPAVAALKSNIQAAPSKGLPHTEGPPLRQAIARQVKPVIRLSGKQTGVSIQAKKTPNVRGFSAAPQRFNRPSFRHKVYGGPWVTQVGSPRWFDNEVRDRRDNFRDDVIGVVQGLADLLAARARSRT